MLVFGAALTAGALIAPAPLQPDFSLRVNAGGAVAQDAPVTTTPAPKAADTKKPASGGLAAARERQKKCGAEWKEAKAAGKVEKGMTWPKYKRL